MPYLRLKELKPHQEEAIRDMKRKMDKRVMDAGGWFSSSECSSREERDLFELLEMIEEVKE
jgi:hypothetical protein